MRAHTISISALGNKPELIGTARSQCDIDICPVHNTAASSFQIVLPGIFVDNTVCTIRSSNKVPDLSWVCCVIFRCNAHIPGAIRFNRSPARTCIHNLCIKIRTQIQNRCRVIRNRPVRRKTGNNRILIRGIETPLECTVGQRPASSKICISTIRAIKNAVCIVRQHHCMRNVCIIDNDSFRVFD